MVTCIILRGHINAFYCLIPDCDIDQDDNHCTFLYPLVCYGYLQLYELHEGDPQYLLPNEEYTYRCVSECNSPNVIREEERICEGKVICKPVL